MSRRTFSLAFRAVSAVNCRVIRQAFAAAVAIAATCLPVAAQTRSSGDDVVTITADDLDDTGALDVGSALALSRPDLFRGVDSAALMRGLPVLTLLDGRRFPVSTDLG